MFARIAGSRGNINIPVGQRSAQSVCESSRLGAWMGDQQWTIDSHREQFMCGAVAGTEQEGEMRARARVRVVTRKRRR